MNLQAQLAYLREQAAQSCLNTSAIENPNGKYLGKPSTISPQDDLHSWFQMENSNMGRPQFPPNYSSTNPSTAEYYGNNTTTLMDPNNPIGNYENSGIITMEESISSFSSLCNSSISYDMQRQWAFHEVDNLQ